MRGIKIGIVILNYNTWQETEDCVRTIEEHTSISFKIYVVDNKSTDDSLEKLTMLYKNKENIEIIEAIINKGYSAGNNLGIKRAIADNCEVIFIVNSDVELLNDAFTRMTNTLLKKDTFMMVGPSVLDNNGEESQIPRKKQTFKLFFFERHPFCCIPILSKMGKRLYPMTGKEVFAFYGSVAGCCFCMRAKDFVDTDYLDENVFLYSEEDILAYKMEARGKKAVVDTRAKVWHKANISTNKEGNAFVQFHRWISVFYLLKTYARVGSICQIFIASWNILTWCALSVVSKSHRAMLSDFWKKNWEIFSKKSR